MSGLSPDEEAYVSHMRAPKARPKPGSRPASQTEEARRAQVIALGLERKKTLEQKAVGIVERLIEEGVDVERLRHWANEITPSYYDDVIEERSCAKLCGYPLCDVPVVHKAKQQFRISTKENKIYDITERKKFCSDLCFKRSAYFRGQLSTTPLWLRDEDSEEAQGPVLFLDEVTQPPSTLCGRGEEVPVVVITKRDLEELEQDLVVPCDTSPDLPQPRSRAPDLEAIGEKLADIHLDTQSAPEPPRWKPKSQPKSEVVPSLVKVEQSLREWFTLDTIQLIKGEDFLKEILVENELSVANVSSLEVFRKSGENPAFKARYIELCRKLRLQELEEDLVEDEPMDTGPVPNFKDLQEEVAEQSLKVASYFQGKTVIEKHIPKAEGDGASDESELLPVLPLLDRHAQGALRRRIVYDQLDRVLADILNICGIRQRDISEDLNDLIGTLGLSAHNIVLQTVDWTLMSIFLLKMLETMSQGAAVRERLQLGRNVKNLNLILLGYGTTLAHVDATIMSASSDIHSAIGKLDY